MNVRSQAVAMSTQAQNVANAVLRELWHSAAVLRRLTNALTSSATLPPLPRQRRIVCYVSPSNGWLIN